MTGVPTSICCSLNSIEALEFSIWTSTGEVFDPDNNNAPVLDLSRRLRMAFSRTWSVTGFAVSFASAPVFRKLVTMLGGRGVFAAATSRRGWLFNFLSAYACVVVVDSTYLYLVPRFL